MDKEGEVTNSDGSGRRGDGGKEADEEEEKRRVKGKEGHE